MKVQYITSASDHRGEFLISLGLEAVRQILDAVTYEGKRIALQHSGDESLSHPLKYRNSQSPWTLGFPYLFLFTNMDCELKTAQKKDPPTPPFYHDPESGATHIWEWRKARGMIGRLQHNWFRKWVAHLWDDERLENNNILSSIDRMSTIDTGFESATDRDMRMNLSNTQRKRGELWDRNYCGWWSPTDESKVKNIYPPDPRTGVFIRRLLEEGPFIQAETSKKRKRIESIHDPWWLQALEQLVSGPRRTN